LGLFLSGLYQAFNYWAVRRKSYYRIARTKVQQGVGGAVSQIGFGLAHIGISGLIIGHIIARSSGLFELVRGAYSQDSNLISRITWKRIKYQARRHQKFPKFTIWAAFANTGSTMLPPILFATLFSPEMAGVYLLAHRILLGPLTLIGASFGQVFHMKAVEAKNNNTLDHLLLSSFKKLLRAILVPLVTVAFIAPELFSLVFGSNWIQAGVYARWMIPWIIIQFVVSPLSIVFSVTENQFVGLVTQILFLVIRIISLVAGAHFAGSEGAIIYYSISGLIVYFGLWLWILRLIGVTVYKWLHYIVWDVLKLL